MRLTIALDQQRLSAVLTDSPTAHALAAQLPLALPLEDYARSEKIAPLQARLPDEAGAAHTGRPGDIAYYAPWGNLALFYGPGPRAPAGLVYLGRFEGDATAALREATRIRMERAT